MGQCLLPISAVIKLDLLALKMAKNCVCVCVEGGGYRQDGGCFGCDVKMNRMN